MDTQQFQKSLEIQARQQEQITQILQQLIRSENVSASQSDSTEIEVKSIIINFKCEKYDSNTAAETFIDYFEAQCRIKDGIRPTLSKLEAIRNASTPTNITELKSFLGLINFYERFIPNLHSMCADLHNLTRKNTKWNWKHNEDIIFKQVKEAILNANALVPYDANKRLYLACDARN
ncbi:hypothetical protein QE152_g33309 [Popillia japonica]|uniref:Reverse transcriptase/retrotransposon-derived protein RNase H-like domain-containing protein n=1 Tax=Popillia japonica TaxID=7064 RepID=A0AAW1IXD4_POPJA